jgi:sterol desaturase/sphingolipid hydroxylase (fatty acid hydroxylase superfamily)
LLTSLARVAQILLQPLAHQLLSPGSIFSVASLLSALLVAVTSLAWPRRGRRRKLRVRVLARALLPRRIVTGRSMRADIGMWLFNTFPAAGLLGTIIVSASGVSGPIAEGLTRLFGPAATPDLPVWLTEAITTLALFLAYELALWLSHAAFHKVPFLWEFHKVHHTAETMTPLTVFRVHPVETLMFANVTTAAVGLVGGLLRYGLGPAASPIALAGTNVVIVASLFLILHLQHSHLWISFIGLAGRVVISPAHHQIHHSSDPAHFNRNFGSSLAIWDWAFGTLCVPAKRRERLTFGAEAGAGAASPHSVTGVLLEPFAEAARALRRRRTPIPPVRGQAAAARR